MQVVSVSCLESKFYDLIFYDLPCLAQYHDLLNIIYFVVEVQKVMCEFYEYETSNNGSLLFQSYHIGCPKEFR